MFPQNGAIYVVHVVIARLVGFARAAVDGKVLTLGYVLLHKHCCNGKNHCVS